MIGCRSTGLDFHARRGEGGRGKGAPAGVFRLQHHPQPEFLGGRGGVSPCEQGSDFRFPYRFPQVNIFSVFGVMLRVAGEPGLAFCSGDQLLTLNKTISALAPKHTE